MRLDMMEGMMQTKLERWAADQRRSDSEVRALYLKIVEKQGLASAQTARALDILSVYRPRLAARLAVQPR